MTIMKRCNYCREEKPVEAFSEEHIIPRFMGGSSDCRAAVTRDVCQECNSVLGLHVDAAVAKGFFMNGTESHCTKRVPFVFGLLISYSAPLAPSRGPNLPRLGDVLIC